MKHGRVDAGAASDSTLDRQRERDGAAALNLVVRQSLEWPVSPGAHTRSTRHAVANTAKLWKIG
jgi:hypothetical protein